MKYEGRMDSPGRLTPVKGLALLVGCLLLLPARTVALPQATLESLLKQARADEGRQDYPAAEEVYERALGLAPSSPEVMKRLGVLYQTELKFQRSVDLFQRVLASHPDYPEVNFYLGVSYYGLHDFRRAIQSFHHELSTAHPHLRCRYYLALALEAEGRGDAAIAELNAQVASDPKDADALYELARLYMSASFAAIKKLKDLNPDSFQLHALMGEVYSEEQNYPWAIKEYQAALRKQPDATGIHFAIGVAQWALKHYVSARAEFLKALHESPNAPLTNLYLGDIAIQQGNFQQALPYLQKAQKGQPRMMEVHLLLGQCYEAKNELQKARAELSEAAQLDPSAPRPHYILARVYRKLHNNAQSRRELALFQKLSQGQEKKTLEKAQRDLNRQNDSDQ